MFLTFFISTDLFGYSDGDFRSKNTGNWDQTSTWQVYSGGSWIDATSYPGQSSGTITTAVTIQAGHTVTVNVNLTGSTGGSIYIDGTFYINGNSITCNIDLTGSSNGAVALLNGSLDMGSHNISGPLSEIRLYSGSSLTTNGTMEANTIATAGNLTTTNSADGIVYFWIYQGGSFTTSYNGTSGWWKNNPPNSNDGYAFVDYGTMTFNSSTSGQVIPGNTGYIYDGDVYVSGASTKQITGNVKVRGSSGAGTLYIGSGTTLDISGATLSIQGAGINMSSAKLEGDSGSALKFDGIKSGTQSLSGTGSLSGTFGSLTIGSSKASSTTFAIDAGSGTGLLSTGSISVGTGSTFTINETSWVTAGSVTIDGNLVLKSEQNSSPKSASLIADSFTGGGNTEVDYYLPPSAWHYMASPIDGTSTSPFLPMTYNNLAQYDESLITTDQNKGWVASDGYVYATGITNGPTFTTLALGQGYDYYVNSGYNGGNGCYAQATGAIGNVGAADKTINLSYHGGSPNSDVFGWNLLGNPYTCSVDWSVVAAGISSQYVAKAVYFTNSNSPTGYSVWSPVGGLNGGKSKIPPLQGFFVHALNSSQSLTIPANSKTHSSNTRYKSATIIPSVKLALTGTQGTCETIVDFNEFATTGVDADYDAVLFGKTGGKMNLWSTTNNVDYAINGLPFPSQAGEKVDIPLSVYSNTAGDFTLSGSYITGLDGYTVYLTDKLSGLSVDLNSGQNIHFSAVQGVTPVRFVLTISNVLTSVPETQGFKGALKIYPTIGYLNIEPLGPDFAGPMNEVRVYDVQGKLRDDFQNVELVTGELKQVAFDAEPGIYIIEVTAPGKRFSSKIIIKN